MHNKSNTFQKELKTLTNTRRERNTNPEYHEKIGEKKHFFSFSLMTPLKSHHHHHQYAPMCTPISCFYMKLSMVMLGHTWHNSAFHPQMTIVLQSCAKESWPVMWTLEPVHPSSCPCLLEIYLGSEFSEERISSCLLQTSLQIVDDVANGGELPIFRNIIYAGPDEPKPELLPAPAYGKDCPADSVPHGHFCIPKSSGCPAGQYPTDIKTKRCITLNPCPPGWGMDDDSGKCVRVAGNICQWGQISRPGSKTCCPIGWLAEDGSDQCVRVAGNTCPVGQFPNFFSTKYPCVSFSSGTHAEPKFSLRKISSTPEALKMSQDISSYSASIKQALRPYLTQKQKSQLF